MPLRRGQLPERLFVAADWPASLRFDPSGERLAWVSEQSVGSGGSLSVADVTRGARLWTTRTDGAVAFSPDGSLVASGFGLFAAQTGKPLRRLGHDGPEPVRWQVFSPDGQRLCLGTADKVGCWVVATGERSWQREVRTSGGTFDGRGGTLLLAAGARLLLLDPADGRQRLEVTYASEVAARAQLPDGPYELFGTAEPTDGLCTLGARVLPFAICEASLGGPKHLWQAALSGDPSVIEP
jgi:hypothetical protein